MDFGSTLAKLRKEAGMSQEELANNLNVSRQAVSKWESNSSYPETDKIIAICKLFDCSMDELMGIREGETKTIKNENKIFKTCKRYFDLFLKSIQMFYNMTFKQKISCMFELLVYSVIIITVLLIAGILLETIFENIFILPYNMKRTFLSISAGIYLMISIIVYIYAISKLYKIRYLDYYDLGFERKEVVVENIEKKEEPAKISLKKENIIIRDPGNAYQPFNWFKRIFKVFAKVILSFGTLGLTLVFITCIAVLIMAIYFIKTGPIVIYTGIGLIGSLIFIYIFMEMFIKFIFDKKQCFIRLFIMFLVSIVIMGIASGLFACELTNFTFIDNVGNYEYKIDETTIQMSDNLILFFDNMEMVIEDRDDILLEFYSTIDNKNLTVRQSDESKEIMYYPQTKIFNIKYYYLGYLRSAENSKEVLDTFINGIKNKEIVVNSYLDYKTVMHINLENAKKLKQNKNELDTYYEMYE